MSILMRKDFLDNIPSDRKDFVLNKLIKFSESLIDCKGNNSEMPGGFFPKKWKNRDNIFTFRINIGDRILFTYYDNLNLGRSGYKDSIVFLDYCKHDRQGISGGNIDTNNINIKPLDIEIDKRGSDEDEKQDKSAENIHIDKIDVFDETIMHYVRDDKDIELLINKNNQDYLFYLNDKQYECLRTPLPILISGSAGSGKTTVGIHKLLEEAKKDGKKIAYFTYTNSLRDHSKKVFDNYKRDVKSEPDFFTITDRDIVLYPRFLKWFKDNSHWFRKIEKFDPIDLWSEIKGIIKGFMGYQWIRKRVFHRTQILDITYEFLLEEDEIKEIRNDYILWKSNKSLVVC